jgi:importin-9
MEEEVVRLLADTQVSAETPRKQAELQLHALYTQPGFGKALASIGSHDSVPVNIRQSALLAFKQFIQTGWSPVFEEFRGHILVSDEEKAQLRQMLLELAMSSAEDRKVRKAASYVVSKIASADFPEEWPDLLPAVIQVVQTGTDDQLQAALAVLVDLVDECFNDTQFFGVARDLVKAIYDVAVNDSHRTVVRALGVSVFRSCFDILEMVMEDHKAAVKAFADETLALWIPFFVQTMQFKLPAPPTQEDENQKTGVAEAYRGLVALKLQVVKVRMRHHPTALVRV